MKYYVREPLLAILKGPVSSVGFLTIKRGSVITVKGDDQACGFVEVDYQGQIVLALMLGIELRYPSHKHQRPAEELGSLMSDG